MLLLIGSDSAGIQLYGPATAFEAGRNSSFVLFVCFLFVLWSITSLVTDDVILYFQSLGSVTCIVLLSLASW